ncbi:hypothetical protein RKD18_005675 [Streptomyces phaeoluteigriseus]
MTRLTTEVDPAAEEAGEDAQDGSEDHGDDRRQEADQQGDPGAVEDAGEDVAAVDRLDAQQVVAADAAEGAGGRAEQGVDEVLVILVRVLAQDRGDHRGEQRDHDEEQHHDAAGQGEFVPLQALPGDPTQGTALYGLRVGGGHRRFLGRARGRFRGRLVQWCRHLAGTPLNRR